MVTLVKLFLAHVLLSATLIALLASLLRAKPIRKV